MVQGYTGRVRASNHPEAAFFAQLTTMNSAVRAALLRLSREFPEDQQIGAFVATLSLERKALWENWKRALPAPAQPAVLRVREPHHGPALKDAGSLSIAVFAKKYRETAASWKQRIAELERVRGTDSSVIRALEQIREQLENVDRLEPAG
jgi:hypothetical protein